MRARSRPPFELHGNWLPRDCADPLFQAARERLPWRQESVFLFGRRIPQPRLTAFVGVTGARYAYSGTQCEADGWPRWLQPVLGRIEAEGWRVNAMLANCYRDGRDCVGWHSDAEADLEPDGSIVTLSLGAVRPIRFRARAASQRRASGLRIEPPHGSLYVMSLASQASWQHAVPRAVAAAERISMTFRLLRESRR